MNYHYDQGELSEGLEDTEAGFNFIDNYTFTEGK